MSATVPSAAAEAEARLVRRAIVAVLVVFFVTGFNFASWAARLPAVRDALELSPDRLGLLLLVGSLGSVTALPLSGMVVQRLGARRTVVGFALLHVGGLVVAATAVLLGSVPLAGVGLVLFGVGMGVGDAAMNLEGAAVEQRLGRAIMPRFHAGFSFGTMAGAAAGALAAWLDAPVIAHLAVALSLSTVALLVATRAFLPEGTHDAHEEPTADGPTRRFNAWLEPRTLLVGLVVLAAALTEGAANDWVSLAVVDGFGANDAVGALGFAVFVTAMTGMRLLGTPLLDRFGRVAVLRASAALSLVGLLVFGLVPWLPLALVGVVAWGLGAALGFPVGMSAASDDPRRAAPRLAVVATIGYTAFLAGPPLLGLLAEHVGYRHALLAVGVPVLIGLLVVQAARPPVGPTAPGGDGRDEPDAMPAAEDDGAASARAGAAN
ncbi:MFS transporter [Actinotalea sp. AC32]|nr:MFS transporter [Actinotalea sp. AC32]